MYLLLPVELQQHIIGFLDPIALISLSQCNRRFRRLIRPGRKERAEWLLAKECHDINGGRIPLHEISLNGAFEVDWTLVKWEAHRWACTNCLRLLPHTAFDNHSILGLAYRKPVPGTPACTNFVTSWTPSPVRKKWGRKFRKDRHANLDGRQAVEYNGEFSLDDDRCGYRRWRRHCNECRYILRELRPQPSHWGGEMGGTHKTPIQRSRLLKFESVLDRWFPGLADVLENKPPEFPPRINRIINWGREYELWTMYMVRCPQCEQWQELRSFRFGGTFVHWKPAHNGHGVIQYWISLREGEANSVQLDQLCCNQCFAREYGREALAGALWAWFKTPFCLHRFNIECKLSMPWCRLQDRRFKVPGFENEVKQILREDPTKRQRPAFEQLSYSDVAAIRLHHHHFAILWEKIKAVHPDLAVEAEGERRFDSWIYEYHRDEAHWQWVAAVEKELEENPNLLVDWALGRDSASLR
ncbi:hypothetical protein TWF694_004210 [Orbilia ellipsospora]|uniref:F-box domain-containing protein n=1 Tax=Orbilia ellipsospora TaxID=2528407 RepID=A0AAV9WYJ5_9PEZI